MMGRVCTVCGACLSNEDGNSVYSVQSMLGWEECVQRAEHVPLARMGTVYTVYRAGLPS